MEETIVLVLFIEGPEWSFLIGVWSEDMEVEAVEKQEEIDLWLGTGEYSFVRNNSYTTLKRINLNEALDFISLLQ